MNLPHQHAKLVRKQAAKILQLRDEYGVHIRQLAERFQVSELFIQRILREARMQNARKNHP
jgi:DNA-binding transcriptional regulator LsrR (DeoR family)